MALAEMCKARIAVHKSAADELAASLQALGCCEFAAKTGEQPQQAGAAEPLREKKRRIDEQIGDAKFVIRLLEPYETHEGGLGKMLSGAPSLTFGELAAKIDEQKFAKLTSSLRDIEKDLTETRAELSRLKGLLTQAVLLEKIKYPLEFFTTGTETISGAIYSVSKNAAPALREKIAAELGEMAELQEIPGAEKDPNTVFALLYRKCDAEKLQGALAESGASRVEVPKDFTLTSSEEKEQLSAKIAACEDKERELSEKLAARADSALAAARDHCDYWNIVGRRLEAMESGEPTDDVLIWELWTPKSELSRVKAVVSRYEQYTEFAEVEPEEGEEPPTLLKNPHWSSSLEPLTIMYGTPTYGKVDPTTPMAPFFFLFMGMCFGDAGYGLVVAGILGYFLVRYQLPDTLRKFFVMVTVGMCVSVAFGAITVSWFGDSVTAFPFLSGIAPALTSIQLLNPMGDPMTLLMISLALGFIQILYGLFIAFSENWKAGDKFAACADQGGWILFLCGLVLFGCAAGGYVSASLALPGKIVAAAGAVILVATQGREKPSIFGKIFSGVMSLYNVTGYLGDVLSYSRLLALGLGSAAVGMVINLLAKLVADVPYVGIVLAVLLFVVGHLFSIAVNLLGAFIHPLRLQYVEFFGKFYDAAGHDFAPLSNAAQYSQISDKSTN